MKKAITIILAVSLLFVMGIRSRYAPTTWQTVSGGIQYIGGNVNITNGTLTASGALTVASVDGEVITDDTIDDDSIDFSDITLADFDYETADKMFHSNNAGDVTEITLGADGTFLESNGATSAPVFRALVAGDIPDISATYVSITEAVCYENAIVCYENEIVTY